MNFYRSVWKWVVYAGVGGAIAVAVYYYMQPSPLSVDVAHVTSGEMVVTVNEDGKTRIKERYIVSAPLSGITLRVELDPGDWVLEKSTRLAAIAPRNPELLDNRERQQAEMQVKAREVAMEQAIPAAKSRIGIQVCEAEL